MKNILRLAALALALATLASASAPVLQDIPIPNCGPCTGSGQ